MPNERITTQPPAAMLSEASITGQPKAARKQGPYWLYVLVSVIMLTLGKEFGRPLYDFLGGYLGCFGIFLAAMVVVGVAGMVGRLVSGYDPNSPKSSDNSAKTRGVNDENGCLSDPALSEATEGPAFPAVKEPPSPADERITALPVAAATCAGDAEWHVIHAGKEFGPLSLAELVEKAAAGEIEADDLVRQTGALWTKARDIGFLQGQFLLNGSRKKAELGACDKLGRFHGVWLSQKTLLIAGCVLLGALAAVWASSKPTNQNPLEPGVINFGDLMLIEGRLGPDRWPGRFAGDIYNGTERALRQLEVHLAADFDEGPGWERRFVVEVFVRSRSSSQISFDIGDHRQVRNFNWRLVAARADGR